MTNTTQRYGLQLPNGETVWGEYKGLNLDLPLGRSRLFLALCKTAKQLGFDEKQFLGHYQWSTRTETTTVECVDTGCVPITSQAAYRPVDETGDSGGDQGAGSGDGGAVREGPLGGPA